ncbi:MAG: alcohol dehydrogenase [Firmicutes bacterium HGW-Firmicutes-10]|nr:MAG: alcohol dehydrogenase [Firmicutes bacterium HGW-Firmicutes-10]
MKAIIYDKESKEEKLILKEVLKPLPSENEILVKVHAASVNAADYRSMQMGIIPKHKIFGADVAGTIEAIGKNVMNFSVGDEVVGDLSGHGFGGFAQYVIANESAWVLKPKSISFDMAASVPMSSVTALQALRKGNVKPGQKVLICGGGGGVGTFAVQLAKHFNAEVTVVCGIKNVNIMQQLNADHIINYNTDSFLKKDDRFDLILAINGNYLLSDYKKALKSQGMVVIVGGSLSQLLKSLSFGKLLFLGSKKLHTLSAKPSTADLQTILQLVEQKKVTPVIDRCYPLNQTAEAVNYLKQGHAQGKVVINIDQAESLPKVL